MLRRFICWLQWLEQLTTNPDAIPVPRRKHHNMIPGPHLDLCKTCWFGVDNSELPDGRCPNCHDKMEPISAVLRLMAGSKVPVQVEVKTRPKEVPLALYANGSPLNFAGYMTEFRESIKREQ